MDERAGRKFRRGRIPAREAALPNPAKPSSVPSRGRFLHGAAAREKGVAIRGIGVDVVKVDRLSQSLERFGARMEARLFTPGELEYSRRHKDPLPHLAARFAAKEAFFKAIGTGLSGGVGWKQAEVLQPGGHQPKLVLSGAALDRFRALGCTASHLTLAHDGGLAIACVVIEG